MLVQKVIEVTESERDEKGSSKEEDGGSASDVERGGKVTFSKSLPSLCNSSMKCF